MKNEFVSHKPAEPTFSRDSVEGFRFDVRNKNLEIYFLNSKTGHGGKVISDTITHFYYILEGEGEFIINDQIHHIKSGELLEIPPGHSFDYVGKMKAILIMEPPFSPEKVREIN